MVKENAGRSEHDIEEDPLVAALLPDPAQLPVNATVLRGFAGKSLNEGSWRLYLDAHLTEYVEVPKSEILYAQELPDGGGTAMWVPRTLTLDYVHVTAKQIQAEFLSGALAATGPPHPGGLRSAARPQGPGREFRPPGFPSELWWECRPISLLPELCYPSLNLPPGLCNISVDPRCRTSTAALIC